MVEQFRSVVIFKEMIQEPVSRLENQDREERDLLSPDHLSKNLHTIWPLRTINHSANHIDRDIHQRVKEKEKLAYEVHL